MIIVARILFVVQIAAIAAALCFAGSGLIFYAVARAMGASDINGGLAMGAFTSVAPIGGLVGFGLGGLVAARIVSRAAERTVAIVAGGLCLLVVGITAGIWLTNEMTDGDPYDFENPRPVVHFEIRLPEKIPDGFADRLYRKSLQTFTTSSYVNWEDPAQRDEEGRTILRARAVLSWRVTNRKLEVWRAGENRRMVFDLKLPRDPAATQAFGPWRPVEFILDPESGKTTPPPQDLDYFVRTRIGIE